MLSRVADSLYWMSRYMERTDSILRMLKTNYASSQDNRDDFTWRPVLEIFGGFEDQDQESITNIETNGRKVLHYMFNQFLIMYNSFKKIKSTLLESAFHALSKYIFRFFFWLMVAFIKSKSLKEPKAIFLQNVLFRNLTG